jgi:hypothetical protein
MENVVTFGVLIENLHHQVRATRSVYRAISKMHDAGVMAHNLHGIVHKAWNDHCEALASQFLRTGQTPEVVIREILKAGL